MTRDSVEMDEELDTLLRLAGRRPEPSDVVRERVRGAVREAWQKLPGEARRWWQRPAMAAAAVVIAALAAYLTWPVAAPRPVAGEILYATGGYSISGEEDGSVLVAGQTLTTSSAGYLLVRLGGDAIARMDVGTRLTVNEGRRLVLGEGRIFLDSGRGGGFEVATPAGARVTDVGTQFEVAVDGSRLVVAVREGGVRLVLGADVKSASASEGVGEIVAFEGMQEVSREPLARDSAQWDWIHRSQPDFELAGATLLEFLAWAAREEGFELTFASEAARQQASTLRLHGPPIAPTAVERQLIADVLETAPSLRILPSKSHRLAIGFARAGP